MKSCVAAGIVLTLLLFGGGWAVCGEESALSEDAPAAEKPEDEPPVVSPDARTVLKVWDGEAVREMERQGILVDVSHLNDAGFDDVLAAASRPFVASHSNARAVCPHRRNLTDGQIRAMVERECLVGLNYYESFLAPDGHASPEHLLAHIRHFLALGAENCLALGSDFDGARLPGWLDSPGKAAALADLLVKEGLGAGAVEKILYANALDFLRRTLPG